MPNAITPVQSTKPTMREWMLSRLFSDKGLSQEFYNRLMNLCNYDYPMSPSLRGLVESKFGFEMLHTIEQYKDLEKPVLTSGLRGSIRRVIPDEYYLEFLRLFDCSCCPLIIQEVNDIANAVDGTAVGQLTIVRYIDATGFQNIHLYVWSGVTWVNDVDCTEKEPIPPYPDFTISIFNAIWQVSLDYGATWLTGDYTFPSPVMSFPVWFKNTVNNCIYSGGDLAMPLNSYCIDYALIDGGINFTILGTVNGITPPDTAETILATQGEPYQGVVGAFGGNSPQGDSIYLQVLRTSDTPVTASLATVLDANGDPVAAAPTNTVCAMHTYTTEFTLDPGDDPADTVIRAMTINGITPMATPYQVFDTRWVTDADCAYEIINNLKILLGMYDPQMQISIYVSGQTVFVQVQSIMIFTELTWQNAISLNSGTAIFTQTA